MADVLPERRDYHHRLGVGPGQIIVVVACKTDILFMFLGFSCISSGQTGWKTSPLLTVKHCTAVLSGGGQRLAGGVQLVAVVTDADLELHGLSWILDHGGAVEDGAEAELPPPLVLLKSRGREGCRWSRESLKWIICPVLVLHLFTKVCGKERDHHTHHNSKLKEKNQTFL